MGRLIAALMLSILAGAVAPASAAVRAVTPADFSRALTEAKSGDTLRLAPGVYHGPFVVSVPSLRIVGDDCVVIDGGGQGMAMTLAADGIDLEHIAVRASGSDLASNDALILIRDARHVSVRRCHLASSAFGIYVRGGGDNLIERNQVHGNAAMARSRRGNGIHLWHTERNRVLDNDLADVRDGLYLSFAHHNLISGNHAAGVRYGIHYMYSDDNVVAGNHLENCLGGAVLMFSRRNHIEHNDSIGNAGFGILLLSIDSSAVIGNLIARNDRGLVLENSNSNRFEKNRIAGNAVGAFITAGSDDNIFAANSFDANLVQAYVSHSGINRWSDERRGNYWSDYSGFDLNGDGVGETPYRLQDAASALMATRPQARWFMMSPAFALLDWFQQRTVAPADSFIDPAPLVAQVKR
jgi:nitrous oxidase accessory protein